MIETIGVILFWFVVGAISLVAALFLAIGFLVLINMPHS